MVQDKMTKAIIFMLRHLQSIPLEEVHANIEAMIESLKRTDDSLHRTKIEGENENVEK